MKLPDNVYNALKWICIILLPAVKLFLPTVMQAWGIRPDLIPPITTTIEAVALFIGTLIGISQIGYAQSKIPENTEIKD